MKKEPRKLPLDLINEPRRPVRSYTEQEALEELSQSIQRYGLIHPIIVKKVGERYEIVAGHRRFTAVQMLGKADIRCEVIEDTPANMQAISLEENIQREDVNDLDKARYLAMIMKGESLTVKDIASRFNKTPQWVNMYLRLLDLDDTTQIAVETGKLNYTSALELAKIEDPASRKYFTQAAVDNGATFRQVQSWVQQAQAEKDYATRVQSGEIPLSPSPPPAPNTAVCFWCSERKPIPNMITPAICSDCYIFLSQLRNKIVEPQQLRKGVEDDERSTEGAGKKGTALTTADD